MQLRSPEWTAMKSTAATARCRTANQEGRQGPCLVKCKTHMQDCRVLRPQLVSHRSEMNCFSPVGIPTSLCNGLNPLFRTFCRLRPLVTHRTHRDEGETAVPFGSCQSKPFKRRRKTSNSNRVPLCSLGLSLLRSDGSTSCPLCDRRCLSKHRRISHGGALDTEGERLPIRG